VESALKVRDSSSDPEIVHSRPAEARLHGGCSLEAGRSVRILMLVLRAAPPGPPGIFEGPAGWPC
jgi:hypothetical protein